MNHFVRMMGQVKKLKNGVGVQSLLEEAYQIMGNPILMFNTEYDLMAYTETETDDPIWNEIVTQGTFSRELQILFENEGFIEEMTNAARTTVLKSEELKYERISGKLFNKNDTYVANLVIVACHKPFEEDDLVVFEAICKLITREISRNDRYQEYEQAHQETIIKNLIEGTYDRKLDIGQVGILYASLESSLYVAVADISCCSGGSSKLVYFRDLFKQAEPSYKYAVYSNHIVIIISTNDDILHVSKDLKRLIQVFEQNNIYVGLSSRFENLFELQKYYLEAKKAMQYVLDCKSAQHIFPHHASAMDAIARINALKSGEGIQYFLDVGPDIFINPLLFHDMELNLLGYSHHMEISDPIWQELIAYGTSSDETINLFKTEGFVDTMDSTKGGAILISDKIKYDRISWRMYSNDNIMIGCLSIVNTMKPFREDELVLFGTFGQKFSKEVRKIEFYNNYGQVYSETLINRLIRGKIDDYTFYSENIGNLYDNLMENLNLIVADISQCDSEQVNLTYIRALFNRLNSVNRYALFSNYIVIIISMEGRSLSETHEFHEICREFEQNNIYAGISRCFDDIYELQKYYMEAADALHAGMKQNGANSKQRIFNAMG